MEGIKVLIITTGHHEYDGRLVRHKKCLQEAGIDASIEMINTSSRISRFLFGPYIAYKKILDSKADCVILPDPELHLFLAPLVKRKTRVVCDVHERYEDVIYDRKWIKLWARPIVLAVLYFLSRVRGFSSHAVLVADTSFLSEGQYLVTNRPSPNNIGARNELHSSHRLVYVGDIRKSRGIEEMLQIVSITPGISLDLIGPCNDPTNLTLMIERLGIGSRVKCYGRLPYEESWELASGAIAGLCFLHPTPAFADVIPTKIWEYWSIGIPVLASDLPRQAELIRNTNGGATGTILELSETLKDWMEDSVKAQTMGGSGYQYLLKEDDGSGCRLLEAVQGDVKRKTI